jgi:hypothetical protein
MDISIRKCRKIQLQKSQFFRMNCYIVFNSVNLLRMFENRVLRRIFGSRRGEVAGG